MDDPLLRVEPAVPELTVVGSQIRPENLPDSELMRRCVDEPDLFAVFYERHHREVLSYVMRRTGCAQTAADLSSETFAAAFAKRSSFRAEAGPARAWLYGIAKNQLRKFARRKRVSRTYQRKLAIDPIDLEPDELLEVERLADMPSLRAEVADALARLSGSEREAIELRIVQDKPYAEVAATLDITEGAARVRVSRGLTHLANLLEHHP